MRLPVVSHAMPRIDPAAVGLVERKAEEIRAEYPELERDNLFHSLRPTGSLDGPALHLDDLGEIPLLDRHFDPSFMETRARLRAMDGDLVASCTAPVPGYELYCEERLGLGSVTWLRPRPRNGKSTHVATACWSDARVRRELLRALREGRLRYLHPHIGAYSVWAVAQLLREASGCPVSVIAPPPELCRKVNDKLWFTRTVRRLFGSEYVPRTYRAENYATAAYVVRWLSLGPRSIVLKVPDSAGGSGNLVLPPERFRGKPIGEIRADLIGLLDDLAWEVGARLLVGIWEPNVLCAPSAQLWIPSEDQGMPVVEGLFLQSIGAEIGAFLGSRPAMLPGPITDHILERCWLLGRLFQRLGYVGRCSFDTILVGESTNDCRLEFIECNGRWGGTSTPMTLMNRLFGDWSKRPYAARKANVPGLEQLQFEELLHHFGDELYDASTGRGSLVLYSPGRLQATGGIDLLAFADDWEKAHRRARDEVPARLAKLAHTRSAFDALRAAFLDDHRVLTRGLNDILKAVKADDLDHAKQLATTLDAKAGPHIQFEEEAFYPELRALLGNEFVDRLYEEHRAGARALRELTSGTDDRDRLNADLHIAMDHVLSCGTLLSHLEGLPAARQAELMKALLACRARSARWTTLDQPRTV